MAANDIGKVTALSSDEVADVWRVGRLNSETVVTVEVMADEFLASQEDDDARRQSDSMPLSYANPHVIGNVVQLNGIAWLSNEIKDAISEREGWVLIIRDVLN